MKPMLAHKFDRRKAVFPCYAQPKVNGVRGLWLGRCMLSRGRPKEEGKVWNAEVIQHIVNDLEKLQKFFKVPLMFDGEMYLHGESLQTINSRIAVKRVEPHAKGESVKYCIFDMILTKTFEQRFKYLEKVKEAVHRLQLQSVYVIETQPIGTYEEFELYHKFNRQRGFEGTMYRESNAEYGLLEACGNQENRWHRLMKRKDWLDLDCEIVSVVEGREGKTGQFLNKAGALELRTPEGIIFNAGSGLIVRHRTLLWKLSHELVGTSCRIKFPEYSDSGVPLQPVIEAINDERFE